MFTNTNSIILSLIAIILSGGIFLLYRKKSNAESKKQIIVPIAPVSLDPKKENKKIDKIKNYIGQNFSDANLSVMDVHNDTGISTREIGQLMKSELNNTFSTYTNMVRMSEVKRLLKESEAPISEIAYKCGYSQIPHFNRVFKKETGLSPKEFRENSKS